MCAVKILLAPITEFLRWTRFARIVQSHSGKSDVLAMWAARAMAFAWSQVRMRRWLPERLSTDSGGKPVGKRCGE